ncbi:MAG: helix-turn-helix transcriptional regulator [Candidatus Thioglobus sp.]|jgi:transcriptional regulator with XRE-family HTH domain|nr:helix-turn-helix transcriptional regulator [Candidatus Thioglobus sp.]
MDFHSQKDLFNSHRHQAIRNLFIEKRKRLGLSQNQLALQMQTDVANVSQMESHPGDLTFSDIKWFGDALKISINELESLLK